MSRLQRYVILNDAGYIILQKVKFPKVVWGKLHPWCDKVIMVSTKQLHKLKGAIESEGEYKSVTTTRFMIGKNIKLHEPKTIAQQTQAKI